MRITLLTVLALVGLAMAQGAGQVRVTSHRAWAKGDYVKPVHIEIKVTNQGRKRSGQLIAELTLVPQVAHPKQPQDPPVPDNSDPVTMQQVVPPLNPGQSVTLDFITVYKAAGDFSTTNRFYATAVLPNELDGSNAPVDYSVQLHE